MVDEIQRKFDLHEKEVHLEIEDCLVNGIISAREDFDVPNLKRVQCVPFFVNCTHIFSFRASKSSLKTMKQLWLQQGISRWLFGKRTTSISIMIRTAEMIKEL